MIFASRDKLHERTAPLFLDEHQVFIRGGDLKADLAKLDAHYSRFSDEQKLRGIMSFAHYPPVEGDFLVSKLWDKLMRPEWREWAVRPPEIKSKESDSEILATINEIADAPRLSAEPPASVEEAGAIVVKCRIPVHRGKWRMLPPEAEKSRR
jgi:hypothetical protein